MSKPLVLLGEAWGSNEAKIQSPFCGASGVELLRMLEEASILSLTAEDRAFIKKYYDTSDPLCIDAIWRMHPEVYRTNVFNFHPHANDMAELYGDKSEAITGYGRHSGGKKKKTGFIRREFIPELERLADEIISVDPNLVVAFGNTPVWAMCGVTGISKIRGTTRLSTHTASGFKVLPTYHPSAVLQQWELRPTTIIDLMKASRELAFPEVRRPHRQIWIEPSIEDIRRFYADHIRPSSNVAADIETAGNRVTCIGFAPNPQIAIVIPFDDTRNKKKSYWPTSRNESEAWRIVREILEDGSIPKTFQNGLYDIAFLWRSMGVRTRGATHDSMLLHHALQPESLKGLGFLGSIYTDEGAWKQERRADTTIKRDA